MRGLFDEYEKLRIRSVLIRMFADFGGEGEWWQYSLSPAIAGALPEGEPLDTCNHMGMGKTYAFVK